MPVIKDQRLRDRNCMRIYGVAEASAIAINGFIPLRTRGCAADAYRTQRQKAKARGVAWQMTFQEWRQVWCDSGRWNLRGAGIGRYCMARNGDQGPYEIGNVSIQLCTENSREGLLNRLRRERCKALDFQHG